MRGALSWGLLKAKRAKKEKTPEMKEENQGVGVIESKRRSVSSWRVAQAGRQAKC